MRQIKQVGLSFIFALVLFAAASPAAAQSRDLFNNTNVFGVNNGPTRSPQFVLNGPARITQLVTYHWNFGRGARPGFIELRNQNGQTVGRFTAVGTSGQGGVPNVNWVANVNINLPAGRYLVVDSDPSTWSNNDQSGAQGFAIVRGVAQAPAAIDRGSNNPNTATLLIPVSSMPRPAPGQPAQQTVSDAIGGADTNDWYFLNVTGPNGFQQPRGVLFTLSGYAGNVQLELRAAESIRPPFGQPIQAGQVVAVAGPQGAAQKSISLSLAPGNYLVRVTWTGPATSYQLRISAP
jgi:hypothetical protein